MTDDDKLMKVSEVATIFQVSTYTIRTWITDDNVDLHGIKIGGQWRVRQSEVKRFLNDRHNSGVK